MEEKMELLLDRVRTLYGGEVARANLLGNSANRVYEMTVGDLPAVLRLSPHTPRKEGHVAFELAWIDALSRRIAQIAAPIPSARGKLFECLDGAGEGWIACVFRRAPGQSPDPQDPAQWNEALFFALGELMGRMHTQTRRYVQETGMGEAFDWRHSYLFWPENNRFTDPDIQPHWERVLEQMEALSRSPEDYGIVHTDIHHLNFHVDRGAITLFDFDDAEYGWYPYDIASTLFFAAGTADYREPEAGKRMLERFALPFLRGYREHAVLPERWFALFDLFLRYRRLGQYRYFTNLFHGAENPHREYLLWVKEEIATGNRFLAADFQRLAALL